jgi:hypothetical protein
MREIINNVLLSFENSKQGFSGRKLTAFVIVVMVVIAHIKWLWAGDFTMLNEIFLTDYGFICVLFGMTTYQNLKQKSDVS